MKNKFWLIIAIIALIGFSTTACDPGGDDEVIYELGDKGPGGGIIFYRDLSGFTVQGHESFGSSYTAKYLEAAPENSGTDVLWSDDTTLINGLTTWSGIDAMVAGLQSSIGSGRRDTRIIVAYLTGKETDSAAQLAAAATFGGYNDWFLPSLGELNLLYENRDYVGNMGINGYWSSSQETDFRAWGYIFGLSDPVFRGSKSQTDNVRAIRAF